jgi:hypothetical protein
MCEGGVSEAKYNRNVVLCNDAWDKARKRVSEGRLKYGSGTNAP